MAWCSSECVVLTFTLVAGKVKKIFETLKDGELQGSYYPLDGMTKEVQTQLIADHFLFKEGDR